MVELSCESDIASARMFNKAFAGDTLNTAVAAKRMGAEVTFLTRFGQDPFADALKETIKDEGVSTLGSRVVAGASTGMYIVSVDSKGERDFHYYRQNSAASYISPSDINAETIKEAKVVFATGVTTAISESAKNAVLKAFKIARENDIITAFDPNYRPALWKDGGAALDAMNEVMPLVDIVMPSIPDDTGKLVGFTRHDQVIEYFLFKGPKLVVCKAGEEGCYLGYGRTIDHVPSMPVKPVDTTGAGDVFNGVFLHALSQDKSLVECARLANTAASLKILNRGTLSSIPSKDAVYSRVFSAY